MYIVIIQHKRGDYIPERDLADCTWDGTVRDIAEGQFDLDRITQVICTSTGVDVLSAIARDVADVWSDRGEYINSWERDFLEQHISVSFANSFRQREDA